MLDEDFHPQIKDFYLLSDHLSDQIYFRSMLPYESPEFHKNAQCDKKSDVYSFGIIMFEILTNSVSYPEIENGKVPDFEFKNKIVNENFRSAFKNPIKQSIRQLIELCWSDDPNKRPTFEEIFLKLTQNFDNDSENFLIDGVDKEKLKLYIESITNVDEIEEKLLINIAKNENENKQLKTENKQLKTENKQLKNENNQLKIENDQLKIENNQLKAENDQLTAKALYLERMIVVQKMKLKLCHDHRTLDELKNELDVLQNEGPDLQSFNQNTDEKNNDEYDINNIEEEDYPDENDEDLESFKNSIELIKERIQDEEKRIAFYENQYYPIHSCAIDIQRVWRGYLVRKSQKEQKKSEIDDNKNNELQNTKQEEIENSNNKENLNETLNNEEEINETLNNEEEMNETLNNEEDLNEKVITDQNMTEKVEIEEDLNETEEKV